MLALEIDLVPGRNVALVDLFDLDHARAVLAAFGRAFGKLPTTVRETTKSQRDFLQQSILGLAEAGKVVPVRLSLFAETMKGKPWTPSALKEIGGAEGAGVTFLEEMFHARTANPQHHVHLEGVQRVLRALLPDSGTDIKGRMRSYDELLQASGYSTRGQDFDDLIRILDSESRLITPTERPETANRKREVGEIRHIRGTGIWLSECRPLWSLCKTAVPALCRMPCRHWRASHPQWYSQS